MVLVQVQETDTARRLYAKTLVKVAAILMSKVVVAPDGRSLKLRLVNRRPNTVLADPVSPKPSREALSPQTEGVAGRIAQNP